jgi:hypothetical protein
MDASAARRPRSWALAGSSRHSQVGRKDNASGSIEEQNYVERLLGGKNSPGSPTRHEPDFSVTVDSIFAGIQYRFASRSDFLHDQLSAVPRFLDIASIRSEEFSRKIVTPSPRHQDLSRPVRQL